VLYKKIPDLFKLYNEPIVSKVSLMKLITWK